MSMQRKPEWLRVKMPTGPEFEATNERLRRHGLNTVCSSARCPNMAECWGRGTATFLILGDTCTRHCRFCSVATGNPKGQLDETEPGRVAAAVRELGLGYVVLTSVDRDDLPDFGAEAFARTVRAVKGECLMTNDECRTGEEPAAGAVQSSIVNCQSTIPKVEVLTPDFGGKEELIGQLVAAGPDVFGHNIETVERLSPNVRDRRATYRRSLAVLATVKRLNPAMKTKSSILVGIGETVPELEQAMRDLRGAGCDIVTIGQYLQPAANCIPVERYVTPDEFAALEASARALGFAQAFAGPLVRSSYHAAEVFAPVAGS